VQEANWTTDGRGHRISKKQWSKVVNSGSKWSVLKNKPMFGGWLTVCVGRKVFHHEPGVSPHSSKMSGQKWSTVVRSGQRQKIKFQRYAQMLSSAVRALAFKFLQDRLEMAIII
jgi:hypothetical protein